MTLAIAAWLVLTLPAAGVVLCLGPDGHAGLELAHVQQACNPEHAPGAAAMPQLVRSVEASCADMPLDQPFEPLWQSAAANLHWLATPKPLPFVMPTSLLDHTPSASSFGYAYATLSPQQIDTLRATVLLI